MRNKCIVGIALVALCACVPADTAQHTAPPPQVTEAAVQPYQSAALPYGLNDEAVEIGANDTVPRMDTTLYQRLGPVCPAITNNARVASGQRLDVNRWAIAWQNNGVRPWDQSRWPSQLTDVELRGIACNMARTKARMMWTIEQNRGLGGNMERLTRFEGMTAAQIRESTSTHNYNDALRAWEQANFTYAVARAMGVSVNR